jgi:hypothetical protein
MRKSKRETRGRVAGTVCFGVCKGPGRNLSQVCNPICVVTPSHIVHRLAVEANLYYTFMG